MRTSIKGLLILNFLIGLLISCKVNNSSESLINKKQLETYSIHGANIPLKIGASETDENVLIIDSTQNSIIKKQAIINYMCKVVILEEKDDWIKIQVVEPQKLKQNYIGWISRKYIENSSEKSQSEDSYHNTNTGGYSSSTKSYNRNPMTNQDCFATVSMSTFNELNRIANKNDSEALKRMMMNGEVFVLTKSTEIQIYERQLGTVTGVVQSGRFNGYKVVVSSEFISY